MFRARCEARPQPAIRVIDTACFTRLPTDELADQYCAAKPFPHIALDNLFPDDVLSTVRDEILTLEVDAEKDFYSTYQKHRISEFNRLPPASRQIISDLNSAPFLGFLEKITGIDGLIPDPWLEGGGIHQIGPGGFLKVHTDFNFHPRLKLHRRLNLIIYLNPDWKEEWNGALELWDAGMRACVARYFPTFNRMVVFSTSDSSYHGHPDPLACPDDVRRNSIALYYYTADRPASEVRFARSTMTNYQPRPDEHFERGRLHYLLNQLEIRVPPIRWAMRMVRSLGSPKR